MKKSSFYKRSIFWGILLLQCLVGKAQSASSRFAVEGAVHDYVNGIDRIQALADAFVYEGHKERIQWRYKTYPVFSKDNERKKARLLAKRNKFKQKRAKMEAVYPQHDFVIAVSPSSKPAYGFAVEQDTLIYIERTMFSPVCVSKKVNTKKMAAPESLCDSIKSLMNSIVRSAKVTDDFSRQMDGTVYRVIVGRYPTHMVRATVSGDPTSMAVISLIDKMCQFVKEGNLEALQELKSEITRLSLVYASLARYNE